MKMHLPLGFTILLVLLAGACMAKTGRTLYTDDMIGRARANLTKYDWSKAQLDEAKQSVAWVLDMPDEELWNFIPPAEQPRALNVYFGADCPVHGDEIHKVGGHYPWVMDRNLPFKVKCPVGGEVYPSNDYKPWGKQEGLDTSQKYADDGWGWVDENGNRYWFVGHYIFWQRWRRDILPVIPRLASVYLLTGDTRYAHKAAVMLSRIATEYPKMNYGTQSYHNGRWPSGYSGKILDLDWEGDSTVAPLAIAYDQMYDALAADEELRAFLTGKGLSDPRDLIEAGFLQEAARAIQNNIIHGNMNYQAQLAVVATVLDNRDPSKGFTTEQMVDWIMNGGGEMNTLLYNGISRDGAGSEESIGYTTIWATAFLDLAKKLKPMGHDLFANPRLRKMADFYVDTLVAGKFSPKVGDTGDLLGANGPIWIPSIFRAACEQWKDPTYARVLNRVGWPDPTIYEDREAYEELKKKADGFGTDIDLGTRDLGGYGLAVLESGVGDNRRAVSMHYGSAGAWHGHWDRLNIEMWTHGKEALPEIGYPLHWGYKADAWTRGTPSHYCVIVDEDRQSTKLEGHLNYLASSPEVQVMDASAENAYRGITSLYRRTVAMVDVSTEDSYLLDIFRVKGGARHDYHFHGLPFGEFSVSGLVLGPPHEKGTLMGEDVALGDTSKSAKTGGYQYLSNVRRARPEGKWSASWLLKDSGIGLRMTMLPGSAQEVIVANHVPDPKPGYPEKMEWVIARNDGEESAYVSIVEPYKGKAFVRYAQPLTPASPIDGFVGVQVDCEGRTDYLLSALPSRSVECREKGIRFEGEFGAITEDREGLRNMLLVNGKELWKAGFSIRTDGPLRAKIVEVDYRKNTITLDRRLPLPKAVIGRAVVISNPLHSAGYTVTGVSTDGGRTVLHFGDISLIEGIAEIKSVDDASKAVQTSTRLSGYGMKWDGKLLPGRALVNESLTESWRIASYSSGKWGAEADGEISSKLTDADGDKHRYLYIGEASAGDEVMIPSVVSIRRASKDSFEVCATVPFELTVPAHGVVEWQRDGDWKPAPMASSGKLATIRVSTDMLGSGSVVLRFR